MNKILLVALIVIFYFSSASTTSAKLSSSRIAIGGIQIGTSINSVRNIYGSPSRKEAKYFPNGIGGYDGAGTVETWYYGDSLQIGFWRDKVTEVIVTANN